jgi:hypothetical protein
VSKQTKHTVGEILVRQSSLGDNWQAAKTGDVWHLFIHGAQYAPSLRSTPPRVRLLEDCRGGLNPTRCELIDPWPDAPAEWPEPVKGLSREETAHPRMGLGLRRQAHGLRSSDGAARTTDRGDARPEQGRRTQPLPELRADARGDRDLEETHGGDAVTIRSPHRFDGLTAFAVTFLLGCAIAGVAASWLVSK